MPPSLINQSSINVNRWSGGSSLCFHKAHCYVILPPAGLSFPREEDAPSGVLRMKTRQRLSDLMVDGGLRDPTCSRLTGCRCRSPLGDTERGLVGRLRRERGGGSQSVWKMWKLKGVFSFLSILRRCVSLLCSRHSVSGVGVFPRRSYRLTFPKTNPRRYSCLSYPLRLSLTSSDLPNKSVIRKKKRAFVHFFRFAVQGGRDGGSWQEEISIGVRLSYSPSELNSSWTHYLFVLTINGPLCCSLTQFPPIYIRRIDERRLTDLLKIYKKQLFPSCAVDVSVKVLFTSL